MKVLDNPQEFKPFIDDNQLVLVDFFADWCGPCKALHPELEKLETVSQGSIKVLKVNVDHLRELAQEFEVRSIPTLVYYKHGKKVHRSTGGLSAGAMLQTFDQV